MVSARILFRWRLPYIESPNIDASILWCALKKTVSIHIGEYHVSSEPVIIYTLLGSCVAVCLFEPLRCIGGMNHILLPGHAVSKADSVTARYAHNAVNILIRNVLGLGGERKHLVAKVFGGSHLFSAISNERGVGRNLSEFVLDMLRKEHIRIASYDLGGAEVRKVYFHTDTGAVYLKRSPMKEFEQFVNKEKRAVREIYQKIRKSDVYPVLRPTPDKENDD